VSRGTFADRRRVLGRDERERELFVVEGITDQCTEQIERFAWERRDEDAEQMIVTKHRAHLALESLADLRRAAHRGHGAESTTESEAPRDRGETRIVELRETSAQRRRTQERVLACSGRIVFGRAIGLHERRRQLVGTDANGELVRTQSRALVVVETRDHRLDHRLQRHARDVHRIDIDALGLREKSRCHGIRMREARDQRPRPATDRMTADLQRAQESSNAASRRADLVAHGVAVLAPSVVLLARGVVAFDQTEMTDGVGHVESIAAIGSSLEATAHEVGPTPGRRARASHCYLSGKAAGFPLSASGMRKIWRGCAAR